MSNTEIAIEEQHITPWYKQFWPWFLITLPGTAVIASICTVIIAFETQDSLVKDNYYKEGKNINLVIKQDAVAKAMGIQAELLVDDTNKLNVSINVVRSGAIVPPLQLQFIHPTNDKMDFSITLNDQNGKFFAQLPAQYAKQRWYLDLTDSSAQWRLKTEIHELAPEIPITLTPTPS